MTKLKNKCWIQYNKLKRYKLNKSLRYLKNLALKMKSQEKINNMIIQEKINNMIKGGAIMITEFRGTKDKLNNIE